jgi:hypothetical protein
LIQRGAVAAALNEFGIFGKLASVCDEGIAMEGTVVGEKEGNVDAGFGDGGGSEVGFVLGAYHADGRGDCDGSWWFGLSESCVLGSDGGIWWRQRSGGDTIFGAIRHVHWRKKLPWKRMMTWKKMIMTVKEVSRMRICQSLRIE